MADEKTRGGEGGEWLRRSVVLSAIIALVGATAGSVFWFRAVPDEALAGADAPASTAAASGSPTGSTARATAPAPTGAEPIHADVYFDFKSTRLRADAARLLQEKAALITAGEPWSVLVQGHADQRGDAAYNRTLAQRRAEVVKQFLVELGVPESSIKAAALGQDSAVCDDPGGACQQLNRRVHLELRRLPRTSGLSVEPVRVRLAQADELATDADAPCGVDDEDEVVDWSAVAPLAK